MSLPVLLKIDLWDHPKTLRLATRLGIPVVHAVGHLAALWRFCARFAPSGDLSGYTDAEIDAAAMCTTPGLAVHLRECGWLDGDHVHDLGDHQGKKALATARSAERMKKKREANNVRQKSEHAANKGVTPVPCPVPCPVPVPLPDPQPTLTCGDDVRPTGPGWSPNRDAVHIAKRYVAINPGLWNAPSASRQFEAGIATGIDPKVLMEAVQANKGRKPNEIVDALKPKMDRRNPRNLTPEESERELIAGVERLLADPEAYRKAAE